MKKINYGIFLLITGLAGCASVEDFREMTPDMRARTVCDGQDNIRQMKSGRDNLAHQIQSSQEALTRGYKVHQDCKQVEVYGDATTVCKETHGKTICREHRPVSYKTICHDIPVAIDAKLEKENIRKWNTEMKRQDKQFQSAWSACYSRIVRMTPEEAFAHYSE